ncbi:MAG TPA: class I SAM-dependent methyltransferase [Candidatus Bathyarchaeota archaeon]|nr:class I SAM-dependent methyltransferase [Candidatus Bathyarchaeota archaeon]
MRRHEHYYSRRPRCPPRLGLIRTRLRGRYFEFYTASGVFSKRKIDLGTRLLIEVMELPEEGLALDIGCGYGAIGIVAAAIRPRLKVILTDVNRRAIWLAKKNVRHNLVWENAEVRHGFLYEAVEGLMFDVVLSNPPISAGMHVVDALIRGALEHLKPGGSLQLVVRSKLARRPRALMEGYFGNVRVVAKRGGYRVFCSTREA